MRCEGRADPSKSVPSKRLRGGDVVSEGRLGEPDGLSVVAEPSRQAHEKHRLGDTEADRQIRREDSGRRDYLKRFYGVDAELPTHYDLVINTDSLTVDDTVTIVAQAAGASRSD